jgi:large-conductance mechanosensitive channel
MKRKIQRSGFESFSRIIAKVVMFIFSAIMSLITVGSYFLKDFHINTGEGGSSQSNYGYIVVFICAFLTILAFWGACHIDINGEYEIDELE